MQHNLPKDIEKPTFVFYTHQIAFLQEALVRHQEEKLTPAPVHSREVVVPEEDRQLSLLQCGRQFRQTMVGQLRTTNF